jgi:murein DD-endopeptidase MepM/ murein hydrolase activator NlpD
MASVFISRSLALEPVAVNATVGLQHLVGRVGSTGFATGAHLHYEVRHRGVAVDPVPYL